jgi:starch phosphorylase
MTVHQTLNRRLGVTVAEIKQEFVENLALLQGADLTTASTNDCYMALVYTVRQFLINRWLHTQHAYQQSGAKFVYYLSAEYLMGPQLGNALLCTDLAVCVRQAFTELGLDLDQISAHESEPGLGNGGLGRLAACFLDSLATLSIPAFGYGILYEFGIFRQKILDGWQVEEADAWMANGDPWTFPRPERAIEVGFGGSTTMAGSKEQFRVSWTPAWKVRGIPYNMMIPGFQNGAVNTLRLWRARATEAFDLQIFNAGDYARAVEEKTFAENITKVLYPDDTTPQGKQLRLQQQYFFVACSLADILRYMKAKGVALDELPERAAIQLNDTHPTIAIAELMRLLMDDHGLSWEVAWTITTKVFAYTCHTLLPEALETWPVSLFERLLPRHLELIYEINQRFLDQVRTRFPNDPARVSRMSIIGEGNERVIRMAHLAAVGSFAINGVAQLHSTLLRDRVLHDFYELWPTKFTNVTNGITPRRFVRLANPQLAALITRTIGDGWLHDLERLRELEESLENAAFRAEWRAVKQQNKTALAQIIQQRTGVVVRPDALFDIMVKRLHEYKRQLLKLLHVVLLYQQITAQSNGQLLPRVVIFGAKAAPGYRMAKQIIKLINAVADVVNNDPVVGDQLKVVFLPNFNVGLAERVYPAADLSEQISLAGKEASGTGNMKFALNGALTIGTLDGANVEIRDLVGPENFFLFGLTEAEVSATKAAGYRPRSYYENQPALRSVLDSITSGTFSPKEPNLFWPIVEALLTNDHYMHLADYQSYIDAQQLVEQTYRDQEQWTRMSILNTARCGFFSSDRTILDYADRLWAVQSIDLNEPALVTNSGQIAQNSL